VIDEAALYDALLHRGSAARHRHVVGLPGYGHASRSVDAASFPSSGQRHPESARRRLDDGTVRRRTLGMAENLDRLARGEPLENRVM
jgi:hypothetical protein